MRGNWKILTGLAVLAGCLGTSLAQEGAEYSRIISTGDAAPRGEVYGLLTQGVIGNDSTLAVFGNNQGAKSGRVWAGKAGAFSVVAAEGEGGSGTGSAFTDFGGLSINGAGNVVFFADLDGDGLQAGYYAETADGLVQAIREDAPFSDFPSSILNGGGTAEYAVGNFMAVKLELEDLQGGGLTTLLATGRPGNLRVAFAENQPAPSRAGLPADLSFGQIFGDGSDSFGDVGAFLGFNDSQEVIFVADVFSDSNDFGRTVVYAGPISSPSIVAVSQEAAPGSGGGSFSRFGSPAISSNGFIAFGADLFSSESSSSAIFFGRASGVEMIVQSGEVVPGGGSGVVFGEFGELAVNARGDVVFAAQIVYPNEDTRPSVWLKRATESPVLLAATGNVFETADGLAEVTGVRFKGQAAFNDRNQVALVLSFGSRDGLYVADVRSGYPVVRITSPARRSDQVTTRSATVIAGTATDRTGVRRVNVEVTSRTSAKRAKDGERRRGRRKRVERSVNVAADGTWSFRARLAQGRNRVSVTATDVLGNTSPSTDFTVIRYRGPDGAKGRKLFRRLKQRVSAAR